jgi:outer membrane protein OmpA-like peptidoglycan-associated protein
MKRIIYIAFLAISMHSMAQNGSLKKGNELYNKLGYAAAIPNFERVLGSEFDSPEMRMKLAQCYLVTANLSKAEETFRQLVSNGGNKETMYWLGYTLLQAKKTDEGTNYLIKYAKENPSDSKSKLILSNPNYMKEIVSEAPYFEIQTTNINSNRSDFGVYPMPNTNSALILTSRVKPMLNNTKWAGNNEYFLSFMKVNVADNGELSKVMRLRKPMNSKRHEGPVCFSNDGKTVYFTSNRRVKNTKLGKDGIQHLNIYMATVDGMKWTNVREFPLNSKDYACGHPCLSKDGKKIYFVSDMPGGFGGSDIYVCDLDEKGNVGAPKNLGVNINTSGSEMFPVIGEDGHLYFSSNGRPGIGGLDLFVIPVSLNREAKNVGLPINSVSDDFAMSFTQKGSLGYFSSNRLGSDDIFSLRQVRNFIFEAEFKGSAVDLATGKAIPNALVEIKDARGTVLATIKTDDKGQFAAMLTPGMDVQITVTAENYEVQKSTFNMPLNEARVEKVMKLNQVPSFGIRLLVSNASTLAPVADAMVKITDKSSGKVLVNEKTSALGDVLKKMNESKVGDALELNIEISAQGYLAKQATYSGKFDAVGVVQLHEKMDLQLKPLEIGGDLAKMLGIKPIYFDLGKFNIRKDAGIELDKIVKVMNENPTMVIELGSHTDCRGTIAANEKLSSNRAISSAQYIKSRITNPERISGKGYGETMLLNDCGCEGPKKSTCTEPEHQLNRRTEFIIIKM